MSDCRALIPIRPVFNRGNPYTKDILLRVLALKRDEPMFVSEGVGAGNLFSDVGFVGLGDGMAICVPGIDRDLSIDEIMSRDWYWAIVADVPRKNPMEEIAIRYKSGGRVLLWRRRLSSDYVGMPDWNSALGLGYYDEAESAHVYGYRVKTL